MTKKDFIKLAAILVQMPDCEGAKKHLVADICQWLAADNPRFDETKFVAACWARR